MAGLFHSFGSFLMSAPSVLIAGCGDVGGRLATQLLAAGWEVHGLRRDVSRLPAGVIGVAGDLFKEDCPATWPFGAVDYVVYCAAATDHDEAGYRAAYVQGLQNVLSWLDDFGQVPDRLLFVSSSSVYGQQDGEWVDESSATDALGFSGRLMLEAEQVALKSGIATSIVRLTGIYGPGRERLLTQVREGYHVAVEPPLYGNRIHSDDAAGLMAFLLKADRRGESLHDIYIGVDDAPAPLAEVVAWLRDYLGVTDWAPDASVRRTGSKRCSNARAKALGWTPTYPSYREGYAAILEGKC
jgi:nucleoside-diphosphate-sugar epimerase